MRGRGGGRALGGLQKRERQGRHIPMGYLRKAALGASRLKRRANQRGGGERERIPPPRQDYSGGLSGVMSISFPSARPEPITPSVISLSIMSGGMLAIRRL